MNDNAAHLEFENRKIFRQWLESNHESSEGVWIVLYKKNREFTAHDALQEAICFGWIDGLMKSIDETKYKKYFSKRKDKANWSKKNRALYKNLAEKGLLTESGIEAFRCADDKSAATDKKDIHAANINMLKDALQNEAESLKLFEGLSFSRQKQLAGFYNEAKTDETRVKRRVKIVEALLNDYKGMLY